MGIFLGYLSWFPVSTLISRAWDYLNWLTRSRVVDPTAAANKVGQLAWAVTNPIYMYDCYERKTLSLVLSLISRSLSELVSFLLHFFWLVL